MPPPITSGLLWSTDVAIDFAASGPVVPAIPMPRAAGPLYCVVSAQTAGSEGVIFRVGNPDDNFHVQNTFQVERWDGLYGLLAAPGWPNQVIGEAPAISVAADHLWEFWFSAGGTNFIDHQPFGFVNNDLPDQDVAASSHLFIGYRPNEGSPMDRAAGTIHRMAIFDRVPTPAERAQLVAWVNGDRATGGTITTATIDGVEYRIHTFAEDGEFVALSPLDVEYLLVGGGGCGFVQNPSNNGAGGGAGGDVVHNLGTPSRIAAGAHPVGVGQGGRAGGLLNGAESSFAGAIAPGGLAAPSRYNGGALGSGQYSGGTSSSGSSGGGGAGAAGNGSDSDDTSGGNGGPGLYANPDGNPRHFGGGGGGRGSGTSGDGGVGGGSAGVNNGAAAAGEDGLGGGQGGMRSSGGKGGDGIVIIRYRADAGPGDGPITATVNAMDAPDSARIVASVRWPAITAAIAATDAPDSASIRATVGWPAITARIAASDAEDTAAMSLAVPIRAALTATDAPDIARIIAGTGWPAIMARVAASDAPDHAAIHASVPIRARLAPADTPDSARLSVAVRIGADLSASDSPDMARIIMRLWSQSSRYAYSGDPQGGVLAPSIRSGTIQRP